MRGALAKIAIVTAILTAIAVTGCTPALNRAGLSALLSASTTPEPLSLTTPSNNVNPANTSTSGTGATARGGHTLTALSNGKILIAGGASAYDDIYSPTLANALSSAYLFDPADNSFTATGSLITARVGHKAVYLPDLDKVLVAGGFISSGATTATAEIYDVATGTWSSAGSITNGQRIAHTLTYIPSLSKVLLVGGSDDNTCADAISELYDPVANTWTNTTGAPNKRFQYHDAILLDDGNVLVGGGQAQSTGRCTPPTPGGHVFFSLFNPVTQTWAAATSAPTVYWSGKLHKLTTGAVVTYAMCSGVWCGSIATSAYDPVGNLWGAQSVLPLADTRWGAGSVSLANDIVYRIGGYDENTTTSQSSIFTYTQATNTWATATFSLGAAAHHVESVKTAAGIFSFGGVTDAATTMNNYHLYKPYDGIQLVASGGTAPYTFTVTTGKGSVTSDTGIYYPIVAETATITVTDADSNTATVNVTSN